MSHGPVRPGYVCETGLGDRPVWVPMHVTLAKDPIDCKPGIKVGNVPIALIIEQIKGGFLSVARFGGERGQRL